MNSQEFLVFQPMASKYAEQHMIFDWSQDKIISKVCEMLDAQVVEEYPIDTEDITDIRIYTKTQDNSSEDYNEWIAKTFMYQYDIAIALKGDCVIHVRLKDLNAR